MGALLLASLAVGFASSTKRGRDLDGRLFEAVNAGHGRAPDAFFGGVTELGSLYASGTALAALAVSGRRREILRPAGATLATWGMGQLLKKVWLRQRPYEALPETVRLLIRRPQGTSWPSSHPAVLTAFLTAVGEELELGRAERFALGGLVLAVAASRVYLGVHYPSDVIGGVLLGRGIGVALARPPEGRTVQ